MRNWEVKWPEARPRWGTFSVRSHQDLPRLITDVLLYDALVFPTPVDSEDFERWEKEGWNPELLAKRINQLGDAAFATPWDPNLRALWSKEYEQLAKDFPNDPNLAFDLSAAILSEMSFAQLVGLEDDRLNQVAADLPNIYPAFANRDVRARLRSGDAQIELVAAFQSVRQARRITGVAAKDQPMALPYMPPDEGVQLRLQLAVPETVDETAFFRTLDLIGDEKFQVARRRLWSWEEHIATSKLDERTAQLVLDGLIHDYNAAVKAKAKKTRLETIFLIVPQVIGGAIHMITGGLASVICGVGFNFVADKVKAKFPILKAAGAPVSHHPGSAVSGALSVLAHH